MSFFTNVYLIGETSSFYKHANHNTQKRLSMRITWIHFWGLNWHNLVLLSHLVRQTRVKWGTSPWGQVFGSKLVGTGLDHRALMLRILSDICCWIEMCWWLFGSLYAYFYIIYDIFFTCIYIYIHMFFYIYTFTHIIKLMIVMRVFSKMVEKPKGLFGEPASYVQFVNIFRYCNPDMTTITFSTVATCRGRSGCKEYRRTLSWDLLGVVMKGHCWTSRSKWRCVILNDFELRNILIEFCIFSRRCETLDSRNMYYSITYRYTILVHTG